MLRSRRAPIRRVLAWLPVLPALHGVALLAFLALRHREANPLPWLVPDWLWLAARDLLALASEFTPFLFAPLPLWLLGAAIMRSRSSAAAAALPCLLFLALYGQLFIPRSAHVRSALPARIAPSGDTIRVMSVNALYSNGQPDRIAAIITSEAPDVFAVQELTPSTAAALNETLGEAYPHQYLLALGGTQGNGVWSRHPLRVVPAPPDVMRALGNGPWQHVVLDIRGRSVQVVNVHLSPPGLRVKHAGGLPLPLLIGQANDGRRSEVQAIGPALSGLSRGADPLVVLGDFNLTDQSHEYALLREAGLRDAHREAGWGLGLTFPARRSVNVLRGLVSVPPLVRIDYVFHSWHVVPARVDVLRSPIGSDHHPVVADLRLRG